jgi:hypothetical protein
METMKLCVHIDQTEAIKAGSPKYGIEKIEVTEELLETLSVEDREYLALVDLTGHLLVISESEWEPSTRKAAKVPPKYEMPDIAKAIAEMANEYRRIKNIRSAREKQEAEKKAKHEVEKQAAKAQKTRDAALALAAMSNEELFGVCYRDACHNCELPDWLRQIDNEPSIDARIAKVKSQCEAAHEFEKDERRAAKEAQDAADKAAFAAYVEANCSANQRERFAAGKLPTEEVLAIKRAAVFPMGIGGFEAYSKLTKDDFEHEESCYESKCKFHATEYEGDFGPKTWEAFKRIRDEVLAGTPDAKIEVREHSMWCGECNGKPACRYSVKVAWEWAGFTITHEYALGNPRD